MTLAPHHAHRMAEANLRALVRTAIPRRFDYADVPAPQRRERAAAMASVWEASPGPRLVGAALALLAASRGPCIPATLIDALRGAIEEVGHDSPPEERR